MAPPRRGLGWKCLLICTTIALLASTALVHGHDAGGGGLSGVDSRRGADILPYECSDNDDCTFSLDVDGTLTRTRTGPCTCEDDVLDFSDEGITGFEPGVFSELGDLGDSLLTM